MNAHATEVVPEARVEVRSRCRIERWAGGAQHIADNGRCCRLSQVVGPDTLCPQALMFLNQLLGLTLGARSATGALSLRLRHAHHLFGDMVSFLFVFVSRLVDRQFPPYHSCGRRMDGNPAKIVSETR